MLGILIKKQLLEVFRSYFYDAKKNRMRSRWAIAGWFLFFFAVMVVFLGGMFTVLAMSFCGAMTPLGLGWLYFVLMVGIAIALGAFGSVFNTYAGLYLGKDNDLLLSLPIPVRTIIAARLVNVYLLGAMYSATVLIPTLIVYWVVAGVTEARVICGVLLFLVATVFVLLLSCVLGWVVAKISLRLKNKSFMTVLLSLAFIGAYYFFYFRANDLVRQIVRNAEIYGEKIKGAACWLFLFGRIGEGDWFAAALFTAVTAALCALVWFAMSRSFLKIATASGSTEKVRYSEKPVRERSLFGALLAKEFARFGSSANYMLNCGFGVLLLPIVGIMLLFKGREACELIGTLLASRPESAAVLLCGGLIMLASMNDMAAPSISLEGKSIWIPQSLPVEARQVLRAKTAVQLLLTALPMLFASGCAAAVIDASPAGKLLLLLTPVAYSFFSAHAGTAIGLRMPLLNWTNELAPIKQSGAVGIALLGGWAVSGVHIAVYMLIGYRIGAAGYMGVWTLLFVLGSFALRRWLDTKGAALFAEL